jgi:hypothetical protein
MIPSDFIPGITWQGVDSTELRTVWTAASHPMTTKASYFFARSNNSLRRLVVHMQRTNWWGKLLLNTLVLIPLFSKLFFMVLMSLS